MNSLLRTPGITCWFRLPAKLTKAKIRIPKDVFDSVTSMKNKLFVAKNGFKIVCTDRCYPKIYSNSLLLDETSFEKTIIITGPADQEKLREAVQELRNMSPNCEGWEISTAEITRSDIFVLYISEEIYDYVSDLPGGTFEASNGIMITCKNECYTSFVVHYHSVLCLNARVRGKRVKIEDEFRDTDDLNEHIDEVKWAFKELRETFEKNREITLIREDL